MGVCACDSFDTFWDLRAITGGKFPAVMVRAGSRGVDGESAENVLKRKPGAHKGVPSIFAGGTGRTWTASQ